jgi:hypothetical protein
MCFSSLLRHPSLHCCAAGQEEFDAITRTYYRGAGAAVIAFSTTDRASFEAVCSGLSDVCTHLLIFHQLFLVHQQLASPQMHFPDAGTSGSCMEV